MLCTCGPEAIIAISLPVTITLTASYNSELSSLRINIETVEHSKSLYGCVPASSCAVLLVIQAAAFCLQELTLTA